MHGAHNTVRLSWHVPSQVVSQLRGKGVSTLAPGSPEITHMHWVGCSLHTRLKGNFSDEEVTNV